MAIEFEIDGAGFNVAATHWPTAADSDRVEHEIRRRLQDLATVNRASFRDAYRHILKGQNGEHAIAAVVTAIWEEIAGSEDRDEDPVFQNLVDVKVVEPLPAWAAGVFGG